MSLVSLSFISIYCSIFSLIALGAPSLDEVRKSVQTSEGILFDRHHEVLHERRVNPKIRQLEWVTLRSENSGSSISPALVKAVLLSEDQRFWNHHGVDWTALAHALWENGWRQQKRGASTITMQLSSLIDQSLLPAKLRRNWVQKFRQIKKAQELEQTWTKDQILEAYLNLVTYRGELRGIAAASQGLFGKAADGLNLNESVILAALIRSPNASLAEVEKRACHLKAAMTSRKDCEEIHSQFQQGVLNRYFIQPKVALAPHLASRFLKDGDVQVSIDRRLQESIQNILRRQVLTLRDKNVHDAAALVVDNKTGEVLAYVGGVGDLSSAIYVDGIRALRQAGSTLKPFLYALAFDRHYLTPASLLEDTPVNISISGNIYRPRNYDNEFHGKNITVRTALASSLNVPAVKTLNLLGVEAFVNQLEDLGFEHLKNSDYYGPSLALGAVDVSLWELVNAYRTLGNLGKWDPLHFEVSSKVHSQRRVYSPEASFLVGDILSDRESRNLTFGLENPLSLRFWTAVKTGTSKDMRDNWCIGFSEKVTVGVWMGNFTGEPMWNVTGVSGAAPAWSEIMKSLNSGGSRPARTAQSPTFVSKKLIRYHHEWYIRGTEPDPGKDFVGPNQFEQEQFSNLNVKIIYPIDGMTIARDPDIPDEIQRIVFESSLPSVTKSTERTESNDPRVKWQLNGQTILPQEGWVSWKPTDAGNYRLSLIAEMESESKVLHSIQFRVR